MNVVSLFDGISCARVALVKAGHTIEDYFASEVDKHAIHIALQNFPDTIQVGDVKKLCGGCFGKVDLLIGGSPCQDLSIAKKGRKGLDGERSGLFWEYVRLLRKIKPTWFILENVASMPKKDRDIITAEMGVEPVMFNASLVSAQSRKRLFWTNIPFRLPEDKNIFLKDILQPDAEVDERMVCRGKAFCLDANYHKVSANERQQQKTIQRRERTLVKVGHIGGTDAQANRVYSTDGKSVTLSSNGGGLGAKTGLYDVPISGKRVGHEVGRCLDSRGIRKDDDKSIPYTRIVEVRDDEKSGTLTSVPKDNYVVEPTRIRKLTPIECERLQGLPDNYTEGIAMTNRYRALGNAFNVDVVAHILANIPKLEALPN